MGQYQLLMYLDGKFKITSYMECRKFEKEYMRTSHVPVNYIYCGERDQWWSFTKGSIGDNYFKRLNLEDVPKNIRAKALIWL